MPNVYSLFKSFCGQLAKSWFIKKASAVPKASPNVPCGIPDATIHGNRVRDDHAAPK